VARLTYLGFDWARLCLRSTVTAASPCLLGGAPSRGRSERGTGLPATASSPKASGDREGAYRGTNWNGDGLPGRDGGAWRDGGAVLGGEDDCRRSPSLGSTHEGPAEEIGGSAQHEEVRGPAIWTHRRRRLGSKPRQGGGRG
jgi:hypothetical protein